MGNCSTAEVKSSLSPSTTEPSSPVSRNSHSKSKINKRRQAGNHNGSSRSLKEGFPNGQSGSYNGISGGLNKVFPNGQSDIGNLKEVFPNGQSVSDNGLSRSQNKVFPNGQSDIGNLKEGFSNGQSGSDNGLSGSVFPNGQPDSENLEEVFPKGQILPTSKLRVFSFAELKAATKDFKVDTILRIGVFGKVYKGWLDDKTFAPSEFGCGLPVAVKKLNFGWKAKQRRSAVRGKIRIVWQSDVNFLGRLSHPNLVKLLGYCWEEKKLFVVYEFMPNGNLEECLFTREKEPLSWRNRLKVAIGAARGLAFLHSLEKQIIYGDFKASNILIDLDYNAKLSDIGLGKISPADRNSDVTMQVIGSYGYAARDYSDEGHNQYEKSDVYCFGVVLLEMLCGKRAIDRSRPIEQHNLVEWAKPYLLDQNLLTHGIDPQLDGPPTAALHIAELILECLEFAPVSRPSMEQVVETLKQIEAVEFEPSMRIVAGRLRALSRSLLLYRGEPVGTIANSDPSNDKYQVFVRDFVPSGLAFLMNGKPEIVKNFLLKTLQMQSWEKRFDRFMMGEGVMPASFGVVYDADRDSETLIADFGETSIGKVTPVDSGFWWIILLHAYTRSTGDSSLAEMPDCQRGLHLILNLCLSEGFDAFPTLLCADGCCMIDRRMGLYGYPIEIQALFFMALKCALLLLKQDKEGKEFKQRIVKRLYALRYHMRSYYWLDFQQLNVIYQYKTEEYSYTAVNKFNIVPDSIPNWVFDFMPIRGGYFIGNVSPARMDFRWFCLGNCVAILSSLATPEQSEAIMDLIEERWEELIGEMPLKISYPAIEGVEWQIVTGCDPKNTSWSYHNGGTWPVLLWLLTAASIKAGRPSIAVRAIDLAERRLLEDNWPEFYDGKLGSHVGKQTRKFQTWSTAGYLVAKMMLEDPSNLVMISFGGDEEMKPLLERSATWT